MVLPSSNAGTKACKLVLALAIVFFAAQPLTAHAAVLELWPERSQVQAGSLINVRLLVTSNEEPLNAVRGSITFPTELLSVVSISKANSILTLWVEEPSFSNAAGTMNFSGIVPNPGYQGTERKVITIQFRAKQAGTAQVQLASGQVLSNDGQARNILTSIIPASFAITGVAPAPAAEEPDTLPATPVEPPAPTVTPNPVPTPIEVPQSESELGLWSTLMRFITEGTVPASTFLIYVLISTLIIVWLALRELGYRIKIYRVDTRSASRARRVRVEEGSE